jgi:hypothetical protein
MKNAGFFKEKCKNILGNIQIIFSQSGFFLQVTHYQAIGVGQNKEHKNPEAQKINFLRLWINL